MISSGRIIQLHRSSCVVDTGEGAVVATLRGSLAVRGRVYVGDMVELTKPQTPGATATICRCRPRRNRLQRPAVANIDQLLLVYSCKEPDPDLEVLDRCLVSSEYEEIPATLVCNKTDLADRRRRREVEEINAIYNRSGYHVHCMSARSGEGLPELRRLCSDKISVLGGISGVGKTSILNSLLPEHRFRTADVSRGHGRGVHTTTGTSLVPLPEGGYLADTPGFSAVDLPCMEEDELQACFPEIVSRMGSCRFNNCSHHDEPGCSVRATAKQGTIGLSRYNHFVKFYDHLRERRQTCPGKRGRGGR